MALEQYIKAVKHDAAQYTRGLRELLPEGPLWGFGVHIAPPVDSIQDAIAGTIGEVWQDTIAGSGNQTVARGGVAK
jgi:hypothetical protein